ncbi:hypothetical protein LEL_10795 [Akanthomyces lecanii RCEF 1005]|uniref:Uncharacterized protein n=1 Tax=Akanthomyces lecanii RCEF 1005 TaxID=1081108 RepID=A0A167THS7_CORDF|nr:hypothetical protein LEL_10795 [Akanthomyces lecanii RCEF 1005]
MAPAPPNAANTGSAPLRGAPEGPVLTHPPLRREQQPNPTAVYPAATDDEEDDTAPDAEALIAEAQDQLDTRASILRAYAQAIAKCAEQFSSGYGKHFAQHLRTTLLQHWKAACHGGPSPTPAHTVTTNNKANAPRSFVGVARAAHETQPGYRIITPKETPKRRRQTPRNDKRILIRLREDSEFFDKGLQIQFAIRDKLHLQLADLLDIKETNTGFALTPRTFEIQQKILQQQQLWGPLVGLGIAEKDIQWHTYLVKNFPRTILSWDGTELDYKSTVEEAIKQQTGLHPVRWRSTDTDGPTTTLVIHFDQALKSRFRLLNCGDLSIHRTGSRRIALYVWVALARTLQDPQTVLPAPGPPWMANEHSLRLITNTLHSRAKLHTNAGSAPNI